MQKPSVKRSLFAYMDSRPAGVITGWELFAAMESRTGRKTYPGTLLQYAREYADVSGSTLECVNPAESRYQYTPGYKVAGAIE